MQRQPAHGMVRHTRRRRRRWLMWSGIGFGTVVILIVAALVADYIYLGTLPTHILVKNLQTDGPGTNILLVGSTDRCALKHQNNAYGNCAAGVTGINSDIVMVAHLGGNGKVSLLSIPRDLFVPNARKGNNANKIDAALYNGPSQLAAAVEEDFGIPINHFIELNFDTFANVVDAVGGIDMYFPRRVFDAYSSLNIEKPGCYHLDGIHALQVVRARHLQIQYSLADGTNPRNWPNEPLSDLARIRRTHEFMRVVAAKLAAQGIGNPITDQNLATTILPDLTVDNGFSESEMVSLAASYAGTNIAKVPQLTYPIVVNQTGSYTYQGVPGYGDVEFPIQPGGWQTVDEIFGAKPNQSPWTNKPLPIPSAFNISVENGTGVANQAAIVAEALNHKGFKVNLTGDRTPVGTPEETFVWYGGPPPPSSGNWKSASLEAALRVMTVLQGPVTLGYDPSMVTANDMVTVQTGSDLTIATKNWAAPPTTTTSTSTSTTTTIRGGTTTTTAVTATTVFDPPGVSSDNNLSAPSYTAQPLEPWDPRACSAGMPVMVDRSKQ
jgi:LCP family protein required for cell wall assembly